ncbi:MAG: dienelactone hydrolase family protein [Anaerolineales bacterium]|nr:dienelactone hydrolase family protein [Anaerolineales bacterium]
MDNPQPQSIRIGDWHLRIRIPQGEGPFPLGLMLHGWTGDEKAMWVFAPRLPQNWTLVAPRGLYKAPFGGYAWSAQRSMGWPRLEDFDPAIEALIKLLTPQNLPQANLDSLHMIGFSQGAALAYAFALRHPTRLASLSGLAGFVPDGADSRITDDLLRGLPVFITHGTRDELVPVARARESATLLKRAGALVTYCEDDTGHKLSLTCFRGLQAFYQNPNPGCCVD